MLIKIKTLVVAALGWARNHRTLVASFVHATISWVALYIAFLAESGFSPQRVELSDFLWSAAVLIAIRIPVNYGLRLHVSRWRFVGSRDFFRLAVTHLRLVLQNTKHWLTY